MQRDRNQCILTLRHRRNIGWLRFGSCRCEHGMYLPSVMSLVVEELNDTDDFWHFNSGMLDMAA